MSVWSALLILTGPVYLELRQVARRAFCLNLTAAARPLVCAQIGPRDLCLECERSSC